MVRVTFKLTEDGDTVKKELLVSVVPFPSINPNCIVSIFTLPLILNSNTHSITFIARSSNFMIHIPLYLLYIL